MHVGRVTALYWPGDRDAAAALAELADRAGPWPGIIDPFDAAVRVVVVRDASRFDSLTRGRLPEWGVGAAVPHANLVIVRLVDDPRQILRHELAHLALHAAVPIVPRWFDEGYAVRAADEWNRLDALRVNWALLRGDVPTLGGLNRMLRSETAASAETSYALAATAVLLLERLGGERGLEPLITTLKSESDFDRALRTTYQLTLGQFEDRWRRDLRHRYGWVLLMSTFSAFWAVVGVLLAILWWWRRDRNRLRRAALDEGWIIPDGESDSAA